MMVNHVFYQAPYFDDPEPLRKILKDYDGQPLKETPMSDTPDEQPPAEGEQPTETPEAPAEPAEDSPASDE